MEFIHELLFTLGGTVCHQLPERSLFVDGRQLPLCIRCTGIHFSLWYGFGLLFFLNRAWVFALTPMTVRIILVVSMIPVGLDVASHYFGWRHGNNDLRFITGIFAGLGIGLFLSKTVLSVSALLQNQEKVFPLRLIIGLFFLLPIGFAIYRGDDTLLNALLYLQGFSIILIFTFLWGLFIGFLREASGKNFPKTYTWLSIGLFLSIGQAVIFSIIRS
jgi:uncharacterized membrane protein